jgi:hypothetical protein
MQSVWSSISSRLGRRQTSLLFPPFMADRRSGYVVVQVWFRLGIFISVLFCIRNRLSSDCVWALP